MELSLGENIRRMRVEQGLTQRQLAFAFGVSVQAVSKWERALAYPDVTLLLPIARYFSVSLDELFERQDEK